jgi:hypothetical protein
MKNCIVNCKVRGGEEEKRRKGDRETKKKDEMIINKNPIPGGVRGGLNIN